MLAERPALSIAFGDLVAEFPSSLLRPPPPNSPSPRIINNDIMKRLLFIILLLPLASSFVACDRDEPETEEQKSANQHNNRIVDPGGQEVTH